MFRELGDTAMVARVLWGLGNAYYFSGQNEAARDALVEDVEMLRTLSDPFSLAWALHTLGLAYYRLGQAVTHSAPVWRESLRHFAAVGDISGITILLNDFGLLAFAQGDVLRAARLSSASDRLADTGGAMLGTLVSEFEDANAAQAGMDQTVVEAAREEGRRMSVEEAVQYAFAETASVANVGASMGSRS